MNPATLSAAVGCLPILAEQFAPYIDEACQKFEINTDQRLAAFLAQIGHESGSFKYTEELADGSAYEGRVSLGNTVPGDGKKFRGHGLIQITGRYNHAAARDALETFGCPDFEKEPQKLAEPRWAALSAGWFWQSHGCNELADIGAFENITRKINGGLNGQPDRVRRWEKAKAILVFTAGPVSTVEPITNPPKDKGITMLPLIPILGALLPSLIEKLDIPKLVDMFKPGVPVSERNVKAATMVFDIAKSALQANNEQEVVQRLDSDPSAIEVVRKAVTDSWFQISEAGGGGIEGARKADVAFVASATSFLDVFKSPSFWALILLLPLVYLIVLSIVGVVGTVEWSADVRAAIAGTIVGTIVGGAVGYYWGQTTTKNRTPATQES